MEMKNISEEKASIINEINQFLSELHTSFPWLVNEIALSMLLKFGLNSVYVQSVFENIPVELSIKKLEEAVPECFQNESIPTSFDSLLDLTKDSIKNLFSKSVFYQNEPHEPQGEGCTPWDENKEEIKNLFGITGEISQEEKEKIQTIFRIKNQINSFTMKRESFRQKKEAFNDEISIINIITDTLRSSASV